MTAPCRACRAVAVISMTSRSKLRPGSWTAMRGEPLHLGLGVDDRHPHPVVLLGGAGRDLGDPQRVGVVRQHDHLDGMAAR